MRASQKPLVLALLFVTGVAGVAAVHYRTAIFASSLARGSERSTEAALSTASSIMAAGATGSLSAPLPAALLPGGRVARAAETSSSASSSDDTAGDSLLPAASVTGGSPAVAATASGKTAKKIAKPSPSTASSQSSEDDHSASSYFIMPAAGHNWGILHGHNAVDIANTCGTHVVAAAAGTIATIGQGWDGGYGNDVVIDHPNGTQTLYAHLETVDVSVGDAVGQGDPLGAMGETGKATGCHVHFEVHGARNPFAFK